MAPETQIALVMLVKMLHQQGSIEGHAYSNALKVAFDDPGASEPLRGLAATIDKELELMGQASPAL